MGVSPRKTTPSMSKAIPNEGVDCEETSENKREIEGKTGHNRSLFRLCKAFARHRKLISEKMVEARLVGTRRETEWGLFNHRKLININNI